MAASDNSSRSGKPSEHQADPEKTSSVEERNSLGKYEGTLEDVQSENPLSQFTEDEIRRTWRKVDLHILPVAVLLYLSSYIDRLAEFT